MWRLGTNPRRLLGSAAVSSVGDGLLITGLPLLALATNGRPLAVAAVFAAGRVPWMFALVFGSIADRRDARQVMVWADLLRGGILSTVGAYIVVSDRPIPLWALLGLALVMSIGSIFFFAGTQRAIPAVVESHHLEEANGTMGSVTTAGEQFIGPILGAQFLTNGKFPIIGDAISFVGSAAVLSRLDPIPPHASETNLVEDIVAGFNWFRRSPLILALTGLNTVAAMFSGGVLATEAVLVRTTLKQSTGWFGVFTAVLAAGSIVGGFLAPRAIKVLGHNAFGLAILGTALAYLACFGSRSIPFVYFVMFLQQVSLMVGVVSSISIRQRAIPPALRGRVITLTRSMAYGSQVLGALVGGWLAEKSGTDAVFLVAGLVITLGTLVSARTLRRLIIEATVR
jgi:MFS family permease